MTCPSVAAITEAAKLATRSRPRPGIAFFREACRALVLVAPPAAAYKWGRLTLNLPACGAEDGGALLLDYLDNPPSPPPTEADMRVLFVKLAILSSPDEETARRNWAKVFDLPSAEEEPLNPA